MNINGLNYYLVSILMYLANTVWFVAMLHRYCNPRKNHFIVNNTIRDALGSWGVLTVVTALLAGVVLACNVYGTKINGVIIGALQLALCIYFWLINVKRLER